MQAFAVPTVVCEPRPSGKACVGLTRLRQ
jgi:hypothetical protein